MIVVKDPKNPKGIVWLASYPKSGNTWLRMFLYQLVRIQGGYPREPDELNKLDRASGYEARLFSLFEGSLGKPVAGASDNEVMSVRALVHALVADRAPSVALLKTHNLLGQIGTAPLINLAVSLGAIYIVRDPRDVAPSLAKHLGTDIDGAIAVMNLPEFSTPNQPEQVFEVWGSWSEHVRSWTVPQQGAVLVVRYEDMLTRPTDTFSAIVRHLRQKAPPGQITEAIELSSFDRLKRQEDDYEFRERSVHADRFFVAGTAGGWKEKLTAAQADAIVGAHREQMEKFGYLG
jgi:hypothetical protein